MNQFPRMLFKCPGAELFDGTRYATTIIEHDEDMSAALEDGWRATMQEAKALYAENSVGSVGGGVQTIVAAVAEPEAAAPAPAATAAQAPAATATEQVDHEAERAALKAKAAELKIIYARNATNEKLAELVAAAQAQVEG